MKAARAEKPAKRLAGKSADSSACEKLESKEKAAESVLLALREISEAVEPRTRTRLRAAMRRVGLDEWKIAWLLNFKIHYLAQSSNSSDSKLLLDYLKEAARHLDPASARAATPENPMVETIHMASGPDIEDCDGA